MTNYQAEALRLVQQALNALDQAEELGATSLHDEHWEAIRKARRYTIKAQLELEK